MTASVSWVITMKRLGVVLAVIGLVTVGVGGQESLDVYFLNVGHGDAILVKYLNWECLIDTGTRQYWKDGSYCTQLLDGIVSEPIEVFVLSHADEDHYNGFQFIAERYGIVSVWHGPDPADEAGGERFLSGVVPTYCNRLLSWSEEGSPIAIGPLHWEPLHPQAGANGDDDDKSLVLKLTYGNTVYLFAGDIHRSGQRAIRQRFPIGLAHPQQVVIVKLPHHGGDNYVDWDFLRWTGADYAVCSSDNDCAYALQTCADLGMLTYMTLGLQMIHVHQPGPNDAPMVDVMK